MVECKPLSEFDMNYTRQKSHSVIDQDDGTSHRLALELAELPVSADTIDQSRRPHEAIRGILRYEGLPCPTANPLHLAAGSASRAERRRGCCPPWPPRRSVSPRPASPAAGRPWPSPPPLSRPACCGSSATPSGRSPRDASSPRPTVWCRASCRGRTDVSASRSS